MEYFFANDSLCCDLGDLLEQLEIEEEEVKDLPEDWTYEAEEVELEPMFVLGADMLNDILSDRFEERFSEDAPEYDKINKILKDNIDFDKINALIPKLYYSTGKIKTITKADLLEYIG